MDISTIVAYRWNNDTSVSTSGSNDWTTSEFNIINLNINYVNYLGYTWTDMISSTTWQLGGIPSSGITVKQSLYYEKNGIVYNSKIGLIYASDFGYASTPDAWTFSMYSYDNSSTRYNNWIFMGLNESIITPLTTNSYYVINTRSFNIPYTAAYSSGYAVRPSFYLNSDVQYISGSSTQSDPFRIA